MAVKYGIASKEVEFNDHISPEYHSMQKRNKNNSRG
jgi:hypothetical protein